MSSAAASYPVHASVPAPPERFTRIGVLLRILALYLPVGMVLMFLPAISAYQIARHGGSFLQDYGERYRHSLNWVVSFYAWMYYLSDEFPSWGEEGQAGFQIEFSGQPSIGSALLRFVMVIPIAIFLSLLSFVGLAMAMIAGVSVLISQTVPAFVEPWQRKLLQMGACVLGYYASLVEEYPPFELSPAAVAGSES